MKIVESSESSVGESTLSGAHSIQVTLPLSLMTMEQKIRSLHRSNKEKKTEKSNVKDKERSCSVKSKIGHFFNTLQKSFKNTSGLNKHSNSPKKISSCLFKASGRPPVIVRDASEAGQWNDETWWLTNMTASKKMEDLNIRMDLNMNTPTNTLQSSDVIKSSLTCNRRKSSLTSRAVQDISLIGSAWTFDPRLSRGKTPPMAPTSSPLLYSMEYVYMKQCFRLIQEMKQENTEQYQVIASLVNKMEEMQRDYYILVGRYEDLKAENLNLRLHSFAK